MMAKHWYHYETDDGHVYDLGAEYMISGRRIRIVGCDIYDVSGKYMGYWDRDNMPVSLIRTMEKWLKGDPTAAAAMMRPFLRRGGLLDK